jgi:glycosyltransferase involved in cell wall biosynthesis
MLTPESNRAPLVSICIPTFNRAGLIGDAIVSALGQSYSRIEVLVVDNASTDNTEGVVAAFSDPRLKYIRNEKNLGLFGNFNRCIEVASGDLIHILHSDDTIDKDFTGTCVAFFQQNPDVYLTFGSAKVLLDNRIVTEIRYSDTDVVLRPPDGFRRLLAERNFIVCPSVMVRKELYDVLGRYPADLPYSADYAFWLKVARMYSLGYVRDAVIYYRQGEHSESYRLLFSSPDGYIDMLRIYLSTIRDLGDQYASYGEEMNKALWRYAKDCMYAAATRSRRGREDSGAVPSMYAGAAISGWSMIRPTSMLGIGKKYLQILGIVAFAVLVAIPGVKQLLRRHLNKSGACY